MSNKSKKDEKKELQEEGILLNAIRLSKTKKKLTRDILSMLNGESVSREKNDRPDIIKVVNTVDNRKLFLGVEHFLVEQVSVNKKGSRVSVIKEKTNYAEKIIDKKDEYLDDPARLQSAQEEIANVVFDIASQINKSGIDELKESFIVAWEKHLSRVKEYRDNVKAYADGIPIRMAFLIEIRCNADDVFLNNGRTVIRRRNSVYPVFKWMVEELEKAKPELLEYIILYISNPINTEEENVVAIETRDIQGSLRKQGIVVYEYCDDPGEIDFTKHEITERGLEYSIEVKNEDSFGLDSIPILRQAYEYRHNGSPFVASRSIQSMMYSYGKAQFKRSASGIVLISEFPQKTVLGRFEEFVKKYPVEKQCDDPQ